MEVNQVGNKGVEVRVAIDEKDAVAIEECIFIEKESKQCYWKPKKGQHPHTRGIKFPEDRFIFRNNFDVQDMFFGFKNIHPATQYVKVADFGNQNKETPITNEKFKELMGDDKKRKEFNKQFPNGPLYKRTRLVVGKTKGKFANLHLAIVDLSSHSLDPSHLLILRFAFETLSHTTLIDAGVKGKPVNSTPSTPLDIEKLAQIVADGRERLNKQEELAKIAVQNSKDI